MGLSRRDDQDHLEVMNSPLRRVSDGCLNTALWIWTEGCPCMSNGRLAKRTKISPDFTTFGMGNHSIDTTASPISSIE